jgi:hypothetical protein
VTDNRPKNIEAERSVLGSIFIDPKCLPKCLAILPYPDATWFFDQTHQHIWEAVNEAYNLGEPIDAIIVNSKSDNDLLPAITSIVMDTPSSGNVESYASIVHECHERRRVIDEARGSILKASDMSTDLSEVPNAEIIKEHEEGLGEDPGMIDEEMLYIPGLVDDIMRFTLRQTVYPNKYMAFCGALSLVSTLISRKVTDMEDVNPNLYILGLAESGSGKDGPRKINRKILYQASTECRSEGLAQIAFDEFASKEAIEDALKQHPAILWQKDEMDVILKSMDGYTNDNARKMMEILLQLFTSSNGVYTTRIKANYENIETIINPSLNLFGTCIPSNFYNAMSDKMLMNGLFGRMLIVEDDGVRAPNRNVERNKSIPSSISLAVQEWWLRGSDGYTGKQLEAGNGNLVKTVLEYTSSATELIRSIQDVYDKEWNRCTKEMDSVGSSVWARAYELTRKLAIVHAMSRNSESKVVEWEDVEYACTFVDRQSRRMLYKAREKSFGTDHERYSKKIIELLNKSPKKTLKRSQISRNMQGLTGRELSDIIETLEEGGFITVWKAGNGRGRKAETIKLR